jgi:hypothetical protein
MALRDRLFRDLCSGGDPLDTLDQLLPGFQFVGFPEFCLQRSELLHTALATMQVALPGCESHVFSSLERLYFTAFHPIFQDDPDPTSIIEKLPPWIPGFNG